MSYKNLNMLKTLPVVLFISGFVIKSIFKKIIYSSLDLNICITYGLSHKDLIVLKDFPTGET